MLEVNRVGYDDIVGYLTLNREDTNLPWIETVQDKSLIKMMLHNGSYGRQRQAFGLYHGNVMIGYAVVNEQLQSLDLLHLAEDFRGFGYGEWFLRYLDVDNVEVDPRNEAAIQLYTKLGYEIRYFEEELA